MKLSKSLLLIVDVQQGFMNEQTKQAIDPINQLAKYWQQQDWPIVCSRFINLPGSNWRKLRDWHELAGEPDTLLVNELEVQTPYVFKKSTYSAWSHEVIAICQAENINNVFVVGVDTDECVLATATAVFDDGFTPWVVADACASGRGQEVHDIAVTMLRNLLGTQQLVNAKEIV